MDQKEDVRSKKILSHFFAISLGFQVKKLGLAMEIIP